MQMISKAARHHQISDVLTSETISSQGVLAERLKDVGIQVTQATLSRDLRELQVVKTAAGYVLPEALESNGLGTTASELKARELEQACAAELISVTTGGQMVVCRTRPGHANALAVALDASSLEGKLGTIAGDDTIFIAADHVETATEIASHLRALARMD